MVAGDEMLRGKLDTFGFSSCRFKAESLARHLTSRLWPCAWATSASPLHHRQSPADDDEEFFDASPAHEPRPRLVGLFHHHREESVDIFYDVSDRPLEEDAVDEDACVFDRQTLVFDESGVLNGGASPRPIHSSGSDSNVPLSREGSSGVCHDVHKSHNVVLNNDKPLENRSENLSIANTDLSTHILNNTEFSNKGSPPVLEDEEKHFQSCKDNTLQEIESINESNLNDSGDVSKVYINHNSTKVTVENSMPSEQPSEKGKCTRCDAEMRNEEIDHVLISNERSEDVLEVHFSTKDNESLDNMQNIVPSEIPLEVEPDFTPGNEAINETFDIVLSRTGQTEEDLESVTTGNHVLTDMEPILERVPSKMILEIKPDSNLLPERINEGFVVLACNRPSEECLGSLVLTKDSDLSRTEPIQSAKQIPDLDLDFTHGINKDILASIKPFEDDQLTIMNSKEVTVPSNLIPEIESDPDHSIKEANNEYEVALIRKDNSEHVPESYITNTQHEIQDMDRFSEQIPQTESELKLSAKRMNVEFDVVLPGNDSSENVLKDYGLLKDKELADVNSTYANMSSEIHQDIEPHSNPRTNRVNQRLDIVLICNDESEDVLEIHATQVEDEVLGVDPIHVSTSSELIKQIPNPSFCEVVNDDLDVVLTGNECSQYIPEDRAGIKDRESQIIYSMQSNVPSDMLPERESYLHTEDPELKITDSTQDIIPPKLIPVDSDLSTIRLLQAIEAVSTSHEISEVYPPVENLESRNTNSIHDSVHLKMIHIDSNIITRGLQQELDIVSSTREISEDVLEGHANAKNCTDSADDGHIYKIIPQSESNLDISGKGIYQKCNDVLTENQKLEDSDIYPIASLEGHTNNKAIALNPDKVCPTIGVEPGTPPPFDKEPTDPSFEGLDELRPKLVRSTSLKTGKTPPGTPSRKKIVRFADVLGLDLEDVRHITSSDLPHVPSSAYTDLILKDENVQKSSESIKLTKRLWESDIRGSSGLYALYPQFEVPGIQPDFVDRVRSQGICLESVVVSDLSVQCSCRVMNWGYEKRVSARYSVDDWHSWSDIDAGYVPGSADGHTDCFSFSVFLSPRQRGLQFALRYLVDNREYWDSNGGKNYHLGFHSDVVQPAPEAYPAWINHFC